MTPASPARPLTFLITAGPTVEDIDPVRFISNRATGKLGVELAKAAVRAGHRVIFIHGPISETLLARLPRAGLARVPVRSAAQMHAAVMRQARAADVIIMNAAVADYTPEKVSAIKLKKSGRALALKLKPTVDILAQLGRVKAGAKQRFVLIGFALETGSGANPKVRRASQLREAARKLLAKNMDLVVLDTPAAMGREDGTFTLLGRAGWIQSLGKRSKAWLAGALVRIAVMLVGKRPRVRNS